MITKNILIRLFLATLALTTLNLSAGKQYDDCVNAAKEVLANFDESFPHWAGRGYEIAGFGWFQGHKDSVRTVETRDFWPDPEQSPKPQGFHYHQNAGTYMQIGEAMGGRHGRTAKDAVI